MKKYLLVGALTLFALQACEKSGEKPTEPKPEPTEFVTVGLVDKIEISDVGAFYDSYEITDVSFVARFCGMGSYWVSPLNPDGEDTRIMLRNIPFDGVSTTLQLPADAPQEFLHPITADFPEGFTFSDTEAQTIVRVDIVCNLEENTFPTLLFRYLDAGGDVYYQVEYIYCDRPVTVTGTAPDWWGRTTTYDLNLKKGWNTYVKKSDGYGTNQIITINHQMPVGIRWERNKWF